MAEVRELVSAAHAALQHAADRGADARSSSRTGRYAVMITAAGSGYSRWRDIAVTRWRPDVTSDDIGLVHLPAPNAASGERMVGGLPAHRRRRPKTYDVSFTEDRAEFTRRDGAIGDDASR